MMIVSLFVLFNYILGLVKKKINSKKDVPCTFVEGDNGATLISNIQDLIFVGDAEISETSVQFIPPAYKQRYQAVLDVIALYRKQGNIRKIIDFGCGELSFFSYLKHLEGVEEYIGVDIDEELLLRTYSRILPLTADYLSRRCFPLKVSIFKGSVADADTRLKDSNVVIGIELIEHMYPNELNDLPYNIFGVIQPEIAIFTTPNSEFNVFFPNFTGFRHPDHKFEWTRKEFQDWANNIALRFSYNVVFHGIGRGPEWTEAMGCCSQMAVFIRNCHKTLHADDPYSEIYNCIHQVEYPFQSLEDKLNDTLDYEFYQFLHKIDKTDEYVVGEHRQIPVDDLLRQINIDCSNEKLLEFLKRSANNVVCINNKATLILPYYIEDEDSLDEDRYVCDGSSLGVEGQQEDGEFQEKCYEYWDLDCANAFEDKMKTNDSDDELNWGAPNEPSCFNGSPVLEVVEIATSSEPLNQELKISFNLETALIPEINKTQMSDEAQKCKYTGTIPKQRVMVSECSSSTSVSSDEAAVLLERCSGSTNIHKKSSVFYENLPCGSENNSEESFSECACSSSISPLKYPSSDIISTYSFDKTSENGDNFDYRKAGSSGAGLPLSRTIDKANGKLIKCQNCGQMYLNKHNCLGINERSNLDFPEKTNVLKVDQHFNGTKNSELSCSSFVHRSHSLGNVNIGKGICKNFRYSLNIDNKILDCDTSVVDMDLEVCCKGSSVPSLTDTFGSHSKAADSGYPNSVHDMDLDLTPEQVDEIITETESSLEDEDSSGDEGGDQVPGNAPIVFLDNVENGDVANNNRDGEGNNMEGGEAVEVLDFEGLVLEAEEVEAEQHASDDEGLYLSALDTSNETIVPEENDETLFNSFFDGPSSSTAFRTFEIECIVHQVEEEECDGFPTWLSNILIDEINHENRDSGISLGPSAISNGAEDNISNRLEDLEVQVEIIVPVDVIGGGDSKSNT